MTAKTLERRLARLQAKKRSFDSWTDEELEDAIRLHCRPADELTPDEKKQLQRYLARLPPIPGEVAAMSEEMLHQRIRELSEGLGL